MCLICWLVNVGNELNHLQKKLVSTFKHQGLRFSDEGHSRVVENVAALKVAHV